MTEFDERARAQPAQPTEDALKNEIARLRQTLGETEAFLERAFQESSRDPSLSELEEF